MFKIGQRVVCVDAYCPELEHGRIYTVAMVNFCCMQWIGVGPDGDGGDYPDNCPYCNVVNCDSGPTLHEANAFRPLLDASLEEQVNELEEQHVEA